MISLYWYRLFLLKQNLIYTHHCTVYVYIQNDNRSTLFDNFFFIYTLFIQIYVILNEAARNILGLGTF